MLSVLISLFSVVNPIGAIPLFLSLTHDYTKKEIRHTSLMTSIYFFAILASFFLAGNYILGFFGLSISALKIAGGLVVLSSGYALLNGRMAKSRAIDSEVRREALEKEDISFSPMAMPMLSGPGSISVLITYYSKFIDIVDRMMIVGMIAICAILVFLILNAAPYLFKLLGKSGLNAISRIMGFIVMAIGVQYIITGVFDLIKSL